MEYVERAVRENVWLRGFLMGPTGSGKSRAALELGTRLYDGSLRMTLINTERGREKLYADRYTFGLIDLAEEGDYSPAAYIRALDLAEKMNPGGYYVVDSVSHEWMGAGGILQQADRFGDWKTVRPKHNAWVDRLLACNAHLVCCCRAKMKYEVGEEEVNGRKRQVINMLGVGPVQSDDLQYEFNLVGRIDQATHEVTFSGHVDPLVDKTFNLQDATEVASILTAWLSEGDPVEPVEAASDEDVELLVQSLLTEGHAQDVIDSRFATVRRQHRGVLTPEYVTEQLQKSAERLAAAPEPAPAV